MNSEPIRVLHVVTQMTRGGIETMLMNYDRAIDHSKVQFDFLEHRDAVTDYDEEILKLGGRIYRLPRLNPFSPNYLQALDSFFREHQEYRIVHSHLDCMAGIPLQYAKRNGVPVRIAHAHNTNEKKNLKYPLKLFYKRMIPGNATQLFACGKEAGRWMFGDRQFTVLNNAIDAQTYVFNASVREEVRKELQLAPDTLLVGHIGRFSPQKNHSFLIDIFDAVLKKNENSKLLLVGKGTLENEIRQKCARLGIEDKVIFAGERSDVNRLLQAMDVFVFPSLWEGLSLVSIEAQAAGLPSVFSETISPECIITNGLVDRVSLQKSANEWAETILNRVVHERTNTIEQVRCAGFDVRQNAKILQMIYTEMWDSAEKR